MDEVQNVLDRLRRIEQLEEKDAPPRALLAEVRALLAEAEAWVRAEGHGEPRAEAAVERLQAAVEGVEEEALGGERTLVA